MEITFKNVSFAYNENEVLKNINLNIKDNTITGIVGKSGSGKSTILQMFNGLLIPSSGEIKIGNYTINSSLKTKDLFEIRKKVGLIFQFPEEQFFNSTIREEISFALEFFNYRISEKNKRVINSLKIVGLNNSCLEQNPFTLSNGEKRKVALAAILVHNPDILVLDEPNVGLDAKEQKQLIMLLKKLRRKYNKTIIVASHDTNFLLKLCDDIILINNKKIEIHDNKYEVFKNEKKLQKSGVVTPDLISFSNYVLEKKKVKLGYRDEVNDLIKDIYRHVKQ